MTRSIMAAICAVLFTSGCASTICKKAEDVVAVRVADAIATNLDCSNNFAVYQDVLAKIESVNVCKKSEAPESMQALKGPIAQLVCPTLATWAVGFVADKAPAEWQCSKNPLGLPFRDKVLAACLMIPLAPKAGAK